MPSTHTANSGASRNSKATSLAQCGQDANAQPANQFFLFISFVNFGRGRISLRSFRRSRVLLSLSPEKMREPPEWSPLGWVRKVRFHASISVARLHLGLAGGGGAKGGGRLSPAVCAASARGRRCGDRIERLGCRWKGLNPPLPGSPE